MMVLETDLLEGARMKRIVAASLIILLGLMSRSPDAHAQTASVTVAYAPGWNMVGAPAGADLSFAATLAVYGPTGYLPLATKVGAGCQGFWAYLTSAASVTLSGSAVGPTQICTLQTGWNLVGDPFDGPAGLPAGTLAYS